MKRYTITDLVTGEEVTVFHAETQAQALEQARATGYRMTYYTIEETVPAQNRWNINRSIV